MKKFKVGDKVKLVHYPVLRGIIVCAYPVEETGQIRYGVKFDNNIIRDVAEDEVDFFGAVVIKIN